MKRRDFVIRTAVVVGALPIFRSAFGQVPCPPPALSVEGGTTGTSGSCGDSTPPSASRLTTSYSTPEQLSLTYDSAGLDETYAATVKYSVKDANDWNDAHPLYRRRPGYAEDAFVGCIFDLSPGVEYEVEVTFTNGTSTSVSIDTFTTRSLPANRSAQTATSTHTSLSAFEDAINAASPGDIIELSDGTYNLTSTIVITASGTETNPIYIRGATRDGTVINTATNVAFHFGQSGTNTAGNYIVFENMTLDGEYADDVVSSTSPAIRLAWNSSPETTVEGFTLRNSVIQNFPVAIKAHGGSDGAYTHNCLVYNNTLSGTYLWSNSANHLTSRGWSNDGVRLPGHGNCVWNNTMERYGDSITFAHSIDETAVDLQYNFAYRNFIRNSLNDVFEMDHCIGFTGIYDNYMENVDTGVSESDNTTTKNYGPNYTFRNIFVNISAVWLKLNANFEGSHFYNNTFVKNEHVVGDTGDSTWGFSNSSPSGVDRIVYRNNLHIYLGSGGLWGVTWRSGGYGLDNFDMSHNGYYPDGKGVQFVNEVGNYSSITAAIAAGDTHTPLYPAGAGLANTTDRYNGAVILEDDNPFTNSLVMGATALIPTTGAVTLEIASGSNAKNAGVAIPGITTGFTGAAPDMGAVIEGRQPPVWGAQ